ncbi:hypothetical protein N0V90_010179 [Kalmusia sp. IMI 367209]|nr:hypothetical protein N0V90_010179 [Kalmusia sp. IMI 367209]
MDLSIAITFVLAVYNCIDAIDEETPEPELESLRSTLILVGKGLYAQRRNHYLAEALFRVVQGHEAPDMARAVRSHWPVGVMNKKDNLDSYILTNLVENYAHLNVEEESAE